MLLLELESYGVNSNIWLFLKVEDKINLLKTNKLILDLCHRTNSQVPVIIEIKQMMNKYGNNELSRKEMLKNLVHSFPMISKIIIEDKIAIFGLAIQQIYNSNILQESLKSLKIILSNAGLTGISKLRKLVELDLSWSEILLYGGEKKKLKLITFMITDGGLRELKEITNLTSLNISHCCEITDVGLENLSNLIHLDSLNLSNCEKVTDIGLKNLSNLIQLDSLNISKCEKITDIGLNYVSKYLTNLKSLNIERCNKISDNSMGNLNNLSSLTKLDIGNCDLIGNLGIMRISRFNLHNINQLNLSRCYGITDVGISSLSNNLTNLNKLNISYCSQITDIGMKLLSYHLHNLTELNIMCCKEISDVGMNHLSKLPNLECLTFWCCDKITDTGISYLTNLKKLGDYQVLIKK